RTFDLTVHCGAEPDRELQINRQREGARSVSRCCAKFALWIAGSRPRPDISRRPPTPTRSLMSSSLNSLRDDLIASLHSDQSAESRISGRLGDQGFVRDLVEVCEPFDDYTNDPRMEAAYYLSLAPIG